MGLRDKIEVWQKDLIDMSRRNTLLYYRVDGPRPSGLALPNVDISTLYAKLVKQRGVLTEESLGVVESEEDLLPLKRLERLRVQARDDTKERGVQSLYLAIGLLEWRESEHSEELIRSPLLLIPLTITFGEAKALYTIKWMEDEGIEINPTLRERLNSSFHLRLPSFEEIAKREIARTIDVEDEAFRGHQSTVKKQRIALPALQSVFDIINDALDRLPDNLRNVWQVSLTAHIGRFSFQKLVMRQDLEHHLQEALAHPLLRRIAGERGALHEPRGLITSEQLDTYVQPRDCLEILDADSSQEEAIQAAKAGQSFVLQGPPGTGKSQTIANIIAETLGQGKKVLFVSEKMAALEVVRKRLEAAHLGEFLLDLHDAKQNRREFVSKLEEAIRLARQPPIAASLAQWERDSDKLKERREQLNRYVRELHLPRFKLGNSAFDAYGQLARLSDAPASDFALTDDVTTITPTQLDHMREALDQLLDYEDVLDSYWSHTWRGTTLTSFPSEQATNIEDHFNRLVRAIALAESEFEKVANSLGEQDAAITFGWATYACERTQTALSSPLPLPSWFDADVIERLRQVLAYAQSAAEYYQSAHRSLDVRYLEGVYELDHQAILGSLTKESDAAIATIRASGVDDPHNVALAKRLELDRHLHACLAVLPRLLDSAVQVAILLGLPVPETHAEIEVLLRQANAIAETPNPPRSWLDPDGYAEARIFALDVIDKALWAQKARASLSESYSSAYLEADLESIGHKFREQYGSFLRYLRPQYYVDVRTLRRFLNKESSRTFEELKNDVSTAVKLADIERWREEHGADLARLLGRHYNGEQTDWVRMRKMVEWADLYHSLITEDIVTDAITKLLIGPASARVTLAGALTQLANNWAAWKIEDAWISETIDMGALWSVSRDDARHDVLMWARILERLMATLQQYWQAVDQAVATSKDQHAHYWHTLVEDIHQAQLVHEFDEWIAIHQEQLQVDLGSDFSGASTDWAQLCERLDWVERFTKLYPDGVPIALKQWIARGSRTQEQREVAKESLKRARSLLGEIEDELQYAETIIARSRFLPNRATQDDTLLSAMRQRVEFHREQLPQLGRWVACGERILHCRSFGLNALIDSSLKQGTFPRDIVRVFERRFYSIWLDAVLSSTPILRQFAGDTQGRIIQEYRQLDIRHLQQAQQRLVMLLRQRRHSAFLRAANSVESENPEDRAFGRVYDQLVREATKKRSPAIREIVRKVRDALIELKPCWMMSPLSVSQFVETADPVFDLVIFDEASQVLTEDAVCAIMRGKQLVVVGDERQLPPTSFFAKSLADGADEDDDQSDSAEQERTESVLTEMKSANMHERSLKWHYRSQHESLIAFSNNEFYGGQLITFPGPDGQHSEGVRFIHVTDGLYDRSVSRTNRREAERVVDLLIQLAQRDLTISLGVVALSGAQQSAIRDALANRFKQHPELAILRETLDEDGAGTDAFFIKNLESVQGDERDVVLLSIGYGRDRLGQIHTNFGPVNRKGGERRLNVAVTRARRQMIVVSSIRAADLPPTLTSVGARTLRRYLDYAEHGSSALYVQPASVTGPEGVKQFDSPFEQAVYDALSAKGLVLDTQIGCSGYRIDLAVRDSEQGDRYLLGIECDGASYHSSKTARDRDRLRQAHLETLGWSIHRIWSSDWFANPEWEIEKTLEALANARKRSLTDIASDQVS